MLNERLRRLKTGAFEEARKLFGIFIYFWVLLSLFSFHKALILKEQYPIFHQGFAVINALALAKVVLLGEFFRVGDRFRNRPLIYPILFKSAVFAVLLICFHIIEEAFIGIVHGKTIYQSIPSISDERFREIFMTGIIMFVVLMPFFAFRELERAIGPEELRSLLFGNESEAGAAPPAVQRGWRAAVAAAIAALALGGGWFAWSLYRRQAGHYVAQTLERDSIVPAVTATGTVNPVGSVPAGTHVPGVIQTLYCDVKSKVKAGQLCAKIDPGPYQTAVGHERARLAEAELRLEKDEADLANAKAAFEGNRVRAKRRAISHHALNMSRKAVEQAQVRTKLDETTVAQLQAALHGAEINLGYTEIVAPVGGTVVARNVEIGQTVDAGSQAPPLFLIATDLSVMQVDAKVGEADLDKINVGDKASFTVASLPNQTFTGEITQIGQPAQPIQNTAAHDMVISVPNPDLLLKPGMRATIHIAVDRHSNAPRLPK
jgi:HlyD family secretion protein